MAQHQEDIRFCLLDSCESGRSNRLIFHFFRYGYFTAICTWIKFYKLNGIIKIKKILERNQSMGSVSKGKWYKLLIEKMDESIKSRYFFESIFIEPSAFNW